MLGRGRVGVCITERHVLQPHRCARIIRCAIFIGLVGGIGIDGPRPGKRDPKSQRAKEVRARSSAALSLRDCSKSKRDVYSSVMLCRSGTIRSGIV